MIENFDSMMAASLQLEEPWYVAGASFDPEKQQMDIWVKVRDHAVFACPRCGSQAKRYGYEPYERSWRHADCLFFPCYVHCQRPKVLCEKCGAQQVNAPFERQNSRFTLMFEGYAMMILADVPRRKASRLLRCNEKSLASILSYWVNRAADKQDLSNVSKLALDETSKRRGHQYVTIAIDALEHKVIDVEDGRTKQAVAAVKVRLEQQGGSADNITAVTSDMSASFLPAVKEYFPQAEQVIDKFHVKQVLTKALDEVRKNEQREVDDKKTLFQYRKLFMTRDDHMSEKQKHRYRTLSKTYPKTARAHRIVEALDIFYACTTVADASKRFKELYSWMRRCRLEPMKNAAVTLMNHRKEIMNYFHDRLTNAICEGINSLVQAAKRKARGFNTFEGFKAMIFLVAGKLELDAPAPF